MKTALITGITGQDGHYLSRLLLDRGDTVIGVSRSAMRFEPKHERLVCRELDIADRVSLERLFADFAFDEVYNLAGESFGPSSWDDPVRTCETLGTAAVHLLELIRRSGRATRFFQASSSEVFGIAVETPQRETTPMRPITPYGMAKLTAQTAVSIYRERFGIFACSGILFNHESPLRDVRFVTRKITRAAARIRAGLDTEVTLGNLEAQRDWGFAGDFADAMARILAAETPGDYVVATGRSHTVRQFCELAFARAGLDPRKHVREDASTVRANDFHRLGDPSKLKACTGWEPRLTFEELVAMMVDHDMAMVV